MRTALLGDVNKSDHLMIMPPKKKGGKKKKGKKKDGEILTLAVATTPLDCHKNCEGAGPRDYIM